jgi:hypothetical protein
MAVCFVKGQLTQLSQKATVSVAQSACMKQSDRQFYSLKYPRITGILTEQTCRNSTACWVFPVLLGYGY